VNTQKQTQKYGYLIAAGGTVIALIGFLFIPYITVSSTVSSSAAATPLILSGIQAASVQGFIWLEALLAVGILGLALLLAYSHNPFGMARVALDKQVQRGIYVLIGVGVVSLLLQYVLMTTIPGQMVGMVSTNSTGYANAINSFINTTATAYNAGSWFYLLGMLAVIGGAVYALRSLNPAVATQGQPSNPYAQPIQNPQMAGQQPLAASSSPYQQDWQSPVQPPQQQWQAPQDQYPPQPQQQWQAPPQDQYPPQPQQQWQPPYPPSSTGQ